MHVLLLALCLCVHASGVYAADLIVSAAASLTNSFREVGKLFEERNPGHKVVFNFASSDVLLSQIAKGAPVDVFASADAESMDRAEKQGLLAPGTRRVLLRNRLVLVAPSDAPAIDGLASLANAAIRRIAIGNPASVPAGRYAREALEKAGLWAKLESKLIMAQNVRQALDYVARDEVDAGFVYATDAAIMAGKVRIAAEIPTTTPIVYPLALVNDTRNRALADAFVQVLATDAAKSLFTRYRFSLP